MDPERRKALNIEIHYAIAQFLYWAAACCLQGFTAVFLSSRGMSDGMVGIAVSMTSVAAIFLQLFVSNFCDRHPEIPLKKITVAVSVISFVFVAVLHLTRPSIALIALLFMLADAPQKTNNGLLNAVMVQYVNAGLPVNYGWPRGIGSLGWAGGALIFGRLIAIYSPELLLSLFLGIEVLAIIAMLTMPSVAPVRRSKAGKGTTSYGEMLKSNKALALFLLSLIIMGIGQAPLGTFLNRMIESVGGGTREMGVAILIQSGMELPIMFMSGMLLHYLSPGALLCVSFTAYSLKSVAFMCCRSLAGIYATMFTGLFCYGIYGFAGVLYANDIVQADQKVRAQSLSSLCFTGGVGGVVGNAIGGVLMDRFGLRFIYWFSLVLSLIAVSLMVLSLRALKEKQAAAALESAAE